MIEEELPVKGAPFLIPLKVEVKVYEGGEGSLTD